MRWLAMIIVGLVASGCTPAPEPPPRCPSGVEVAIRVVEERGEPLEGVELTLEAISGAGPTRAVTGSGGLAFLRWSPQPHRDKRGGNCVVALTYRASARGRVPATGEIRRQWPAGGAGGPGRIYQEIVLPSLKAVLGSGLGGGQARVCIEAYKKMTPTLTELGIGWGVPAFEKIPEGVRLRLQWHGSCWAPVEAAGAKATAIACAVVPIVGVVAKTLGPRLELARVVELKLTTAMAEPHDPHASSRKLTLVLRATAAQLQALARGEIEPGRLLAQGLKITEGESK